MAVGVSFWGWWNSSSVACNIRRSTLQGIQAQYLSTLARGSWHHQLSSHNGRACWHGENQIQQDLLNGSLIHHVQVCMLSGMYVMGKCQFCHVQSARLQSDKWSHDMTSALTTQLMYCIGLCMFNVLRTNWGPTDSVLFLWIQSDKIHFLYAFVELCSGP